MVVAKAAELDRPLRVGYVSLGSPMDPAVWSGTPHFTLLALQKEFNDSIHVLDTPRLDKIARYINVLLRKFGMELFREQWVARLFCRLIDRKARQFDLDVIVSVLGAHKVAYLKSDIPILYLSDALFGTITGYYDKYGNLSPRTLRLGNAMQQALIDRSAAIVVTSDWAKEDAQKRYDIEGGKIAVIPLGANVKSDIHPDIITSEKTKLKLLFIGTEWERKGGSIAIAIFNHVRASHPDAELHIVGCDPAEAQGVPGVTVHGYLRKSNPEDYARLVALFAESSFFVLPSQREAFGLVYCEAAAFGLPVVALATGGIPTIVDHGVTGLLFAEDAAPAEMAQSMLALWGAKDSYNAMRVAARARFEAQLNWDAWRSAMGALIRTAASQGQQG